MADPEGSDSAQEELSAEEFGKTAIAISDSMEKLRDAMGKSGEFDFSFIRKFDSLLNQYRKFWDNLQSEVSGKSNGESANINAGPNGVPVSAAGNMQEE